MTVSVRSIRAGSLHNRFIRDDDEYPLPVLIFTIVSLVAAERGAAGARRGGRGAVRRAGVYFEVFLEKKSS